MLFNSYEFMFIFLVPVVLMYRALHVKYRLWFLITASVVFYAQWSLEHLGVLVASVCLNYMFALRLSRESKHKKLLLGLMVVLNLLPLGWFKYANFLHVSDHSLVLPLAISFFTFQQIAFGVDVYRGRIKLDGFREYLFFVLFFPQLIAGPIVHYNELIGQIKSPNWVRFDFEFFKAGVVLFSMGLFKKVVLADSLAVLADGAFGGTGLSSYEAWLGLFGYSFQIYFDFSGYADMAIGLALLFGLRLPMNFDSPYKSRNVVEFWRRWHITLSVFLRDHIYIPLGGNRVVVFRQAFNLLVTMGIGGLWHGAGWNFIVWGLAHGACLVALHISGVIFCQLHTVAKASHGGYPKAEALTQRLQRRDNMQLAKNLWGRWFTVAKASHGGYPKAEALTQRLQRHVHVEWIKNIGSIVVTFLVVTLLWVLFRAVDLGSALEYYGVLFSFDGSWFDGFRVDKEFLIVVGFFVVWGLPNSLAFVGYMKDGYRLSFMHTFVGGVLAFVALKTMATSPAVSFVYFNF